MAVFFKKVKWRTRNHHTLFLEIKFDDIYVNKLLPFPRKFKEKRENIKIEKKRKKTSKRSVQAREQKIKRLN